MRPLIAALALAFVFGGFTAAARAECSGHAVKNDFETPPPTSAQPADTGKTSG